MSEQATELPMAKEQCGTCRFWHQDFDSVPADRDSDPSGGICRRYPPKLNEQRHLYCALRTLQEVGDEPTSSAVADMLDSWGDAVSIYSYPYVCVEDWCGEWQAKTTTPQERS